MDYKHIKTTKFSFILFENIFDKNELLEIYKECIFLCHPEKLKMTEKSGADRRPDGTLKKSNKGIFLEEIYSDVKYSNYLNLYEKPFNLLDIGKIAETDDIFKSYSNDDLKKTLFSYYQDDDYYESHVDPTKFTYVFWIFKEPKMFSGGDFILDDIEFRINIKSNMGVLFSSSAAHTVEKVEMVNKEPFNRQGRFSFSTFII
jgi:Rps23 Pro-64 3,4-dihydroxylase Tpa1-like proline 4-hydroxylase